MLPGPAPTRRAGRQDGCGDRGSEEIMRIGYWSAMVVGALLAACSPAGNGTGGAAGDPGMSSGATATDTTMTGGQGGMADTAMGGMHDTMRMGGTSDTSPTGTDTSRP